MFDPAQTTLVAFAVSVLVALALAHVMLRQPLPAALQEGRRLLDLLGWAALLPQMLAALGAVFALAGLGTAVGDLAVQAIPADNRFAVVAAYTFGMAIFTAMMGNAFAAFPVMTAGIGLPLIVMKFGGDPVVMSAIGMLSGFCGTLMTPMAANFNLVPVALLGIQDRYADHQGANPDRTSSADHQHGSDVCLRLLARSSIRRSQHGSPESRSDM